MIAAQLHAGERSLRLVRVPSPKLDPDACVVEVAACGLCGSDLHILDGTIETKTRPRTLGHEASGIVREVGMDVKGLKVGDHVFIDPLITCGRCHACQSGRPHICVAREIIGIDRDGAFAELVAVPSPNLIQLPPTVSLVEAAMIESAATPFHALTARAPSIAGEAVAVLGTGGLGYHAVAVARLLGAAEVFAVDVRENALDRALDHGATRVFDGRDRDVARQIRRASGGGVAVALECVGSAATCVLAAGILRAGGVCVVMGVSADALTALSVEHFAARELEFRGAFGYSRPELERIVRLVAGKMLDLASAVSEIFPLEAVEEAVMSVRTRTTNPIRVVVAPARKAELGAASDGPIS